MTTKNQFGIILGCSGIGKGFGIGDQLHEYFGVDRFVTGDWCREHEDANAAAGILVNDQTILAAAESKFMHSEAHRFMIDSSRTVRQVDEFRALFAKKDPNYEFFAILIDGDPDTARKRIHDRAIRQDRDDDAEHEVIEKKIRTFYGKGGILDKVVPYIEEFTTIHRVDGNQKMEQMRAYAREVLGPKIFGTPILKRPIHGERSSVRPATFA